MKGVEYMESKPSVSINSVVVVAKDQISRDLGEEEVILNLKGSTINNFTFLLLKSCNSN